MKRFKQYLKDQIPAFVCITLAFVTLILHRLNIEYKFTLLGETTTLYDIGTALLCMGLVYAVFIIIGYRFNLFVEKKDNNNEVK